MDALLIDECLSVRLVAVALDRGHDATHVTFRGLNGTQDWNLLPTIRDGNLILVTNNRADFLKLYADEAIHNGLIVIVPSVPRDGQVALFEAALAVIEQRSDLVNVLVEVFEDGRVEVRDWSSETYEPRHISAPRCRRGPANHALLPWRCATPPPLPTSPARTGLACWSIARSQPATLSG